MRHFFSAKIAQAVLLCGCILLPLHAAAEGIDTEHLFGFMIGADVGNVGERELQWTTTGRFVRSSGQYRVVGHELELEFVPAPNFRIEIGSAFAAYRIAGVPGLDDKAATAWQGASLDLRYRFMDRDSAPFGMTVALTAQGDRVDETSGARVRSFGTGVTLAFDRELEPHKAVAALNLIYQPEWTRFTASGTSEQTATTGAALGVMAQIAPGVLLGGEARYLRNYEGIGLDELAGQALFVGPTAYFQLGDRARLTASWSVQAWGRAASSGMGAGGGLDLVNFERHQARLVFGVNF